MVLNKPQEHDNCASLLTTLERETGTAGTGNMGYNARKRAVLAFLAQHGRPATMGEIAWGIRLPYSPSGLYSLLAAYAHWGLVRRWRGPDGRLRFALADRGHARLAWLRGVGRQ